MLSYIIIVLFLRGSSALLCIYGWVFPFCKQKPSFRSNILLIFLIKQTGEILEKCLNTLSTNHELNLNKFNKNSALGKKSIILVISSS